MRVCIITIAVHGIGGMQDHTRDLARGLAAAGHEVDVVSARGSADVEEEERDGVRFIYIDAPSHQNDPLWVERSYETFARLHAERPYDVVHSESSCGISLLKHGAHREVPVVAMYHGVYLGFVRAALKRMVRARRPRPFLREIKGLYWLTFDQYLPHGNWWRFRAVEGIVPSRQQFRDTYLSCLLRPSRLHVVPNGVDAETFRPREQAEARSELGLGAGPLLCCVGRLNPEKGMHNAIAALPLLDDDVRLVIVGDGEERGRLELLAHRLGVAERVVFAGRCDHERVATYVAASDVFLFPTERDEAAPLVLPQAMACGTAVVASDIGGITEVIGREGDRGVLVPPGHVSELATAVAALLAEDDRRARLGAAARAHVLAGYTIERMVEQTVAVYQLAIARLQGDRPRAEAPSAPLDAVARQRIP